MPRGAYEIRRARKSHRCTEGHACQIEAGHHYLYMAIPPEHEMHRSKHWWITRACLKHAELWQLHINDTRVAVERLKGGESDQ